MATVVAQMCLNVIHTLPVFWVTVSTLFSVTNENCFSTTIFFFSVTFDSLSFYFHFVLEFLDYFMILKASWNMVWWGSQSENFTLTCEYSNVSQVTLISRLIQWQCCRHGFRKYLVSILLRPILNHVCCSFLDSVKFLAYPLKIGMISLVAHPYVLNFCSWNHVIV